MNKFNLVAIILQIVFGLICIGMGIYFCFNGTASQIAIFFVVGVGCFVNAVRIYLKDKKDNKENKDE